MIPVFFNSHCKKIIRHKIYHWGTINESLTLFFCPFEGSSADIVILCKGKLTITNNIKTILMWQYTRNEFWVHRFINTTKWCASASKANLSYSAVARFYHRWWKPICQPCWNIAKKLNEFIIYISPSFCKKTCILPN